MTRLLEVAGTCKPGERADLTGCAPATATIHQRDDLKVANDVRGHHDGQTDATLTAHTKDGKRAAYLDYAVYDNKPLIQMVKSTQAGLGAGEHLVDKLSDEFGYENIEWGGMTPDGVKLRAKMDKKHGIERGVKKVDVDTIVGQSGGKLLSKEDGRSEGTKSIYVEFDSVEKGRAFAEKLKALGADGLDVQELNNQAWVQAEVATERPFVRRRTSEGSKPKLTAAFRSWCESRRYRCEYDDAAITLALGLTRPVELLEAVAAPECEGDACPSVLIDLPAEPQDTDYSCGAAALTSCCKHFGIEPLDTEVEAIRALGTSPRDGTSPDKLVEVAEAAGLDVPAYGRMTGEDLKRHVVAGRPVIVCFQSGEIDPQYAVPECGGEGGKPGPCAEPGGKESGGSKQTKKKKSTAETHPLDGKSQEEMVKTISQLSGGRPLAYLDDPDPWGFRQVSIKDKEPARQAILAAVKQIDSPFKSATVPQLVAAAQKAQPVLSLKDAQGVIASLGRSKELVLSPYTQALAQAPEEVLKHVMPLDRELKYYVRPGG